MHYQPEKEYVSLFVNSFSLCICSRTLIPYKSEGDGLARSEEQEMETSHISSLENQSIFLKIEISLRILVLQKVWKDIEVLLFSLNFLDCDSLEENPFVPVAAIVTGK